MSDIHLQFGKAGEAYALAHLRQQGYAILATNYRTRLGEIDIIARDKEYTCFIEVKARRSPSRGLPEEAVSWRKQRQITRAALVYLKERKLTECKIRFDVVAIMQSGGATQVRLIKAAFEADPVFTY